MDHAGRKYRTPRPADRVRFAARPQGGTPAGPTGDIILTGTPEGVGPLADGDHVEVSISGVGELEFRVRSE